MNNSIRSGSSTSHAFPLLRLLGPPRTARLRRPAARPAAAWLGLVALVCLGLVSAPRAEAQTPTYWLGNGNLTWGNTSDWSPAIAPNSATAWADFNYANDTLSTQTITLTTNITLNELEFNNSGGGTADTISYTISSTPTTRTLTFNGTAPQLLLDSSFYGAVNITSNIILGTGIVTLNITNDGSGTGPQLTLGNMALANQTANFSGTGSTVVSGVISSTGTAGNVTVSSGQLTLSGANTYAGATTLTSGTLMLGNALALQASTVNLNGGTLSFGSLTSATFGGLTGSQNLILENNTPVAVALTVGNGTTSSTYSGDLSDGSSGGSLIKSGTGTFTLSGDNTYTGSTTINSGTLSISADDNLGSGALIFNGGTLLTTATFTLSPNPSGITVDTSSSSNIDVAASKVLTYNGTITGAGNLTKMDTGTLILGGSSGSYSGTTTLSAGVLVIGNASAVVGNNLALGTGAIVLNGGTLEGDGLNPYTLANPISITKASTLGSGLGGSSALTFTGTVTNNGNFTLNVDNTAGTSFNNSFYLSNASTNNVLTLATVASADTIINGVVANDAVSNTETSSLIISGVGQVTLNGTNTYTGNTTLSTGATVVVGSGSLTNPGVTTNSAAFGIGGTLVLNNGTIEGDNQNAYSLNNPINITASSTIDSSADTYSLTFSGILMNSANDTLTFNNLTPGGTTFSGSAFYLSNSGINHTLTLSLAPGANVTISAPISNDSSDASASGLTIAGGGNVTLGNANTYTGATTLSGGTLLLGNPLALQDSTLTYDSGAVLSFGTLTTATLGGLSGTNPTVVLANAGNLGPVTLTVGNGGASSTYNGVLTDGSGAGAGGSLIKAGTGSLTLGGINSYTGSTTINGGTLIFTGDTSQLGGGIVDDANLVFDQTVNSTFSGAISGTGVLTTNGTKTLALTNATNSYSGATNINGGTLSIRYGHQPRHSASFGYARPIDL